MLNRMGITPALLPNERCCGHDLLNSGDVDGFVKLARQNVKEIAVTGAKRVFLSCPEGYHTIKNEYPSYLGNMGFEVVHLVELVAEAVAKGEVKDVRGGRLYPIHGTSEEIKAILMGPERTAAGKKRRRKRREAEEWLEYEEVAPGVRVPVGIKKGKKGGAKWGRGRGSRSRSR